jgi:hypothetical protein
LFNEESTTKIPNVQFSYFSIPGFEKRYKKKRVIILSLFFGLGLKREDHWLSPISATKMINFDVNWFHLIRRV